MWNLMMAGYILRRSGGICNAASSGKKSKKGAKDLETAQKYVGIPYKKFITPVKTLFAYLMHSLHSLLENEGAIN